MFGGQQDFQEGDRAWPGAAILELPDLSSVHLEARLDESDRGRLQARQEATVRIEAIPGTDFKATLDSISVLAKVDFSSGWPPAKNFDLNLVFLDVDSRMRPGMTAVARIATERVPDVVLVPAEAIFQRDGAPIVYRLDGSMFVETPRHDPQARQGTGDRRQRDRARRSHCDPPPGARDDQESGMKRRLVALPLLAVVLHRRRGGRRGVAVPTLPARGNAVPTARVIKGPLKLTVHAIGDLRAGRTVTLVTPPVGGMLRIVTLAADRHVGQVGRGDRRVRSSRPAVCARAGEVRAGRGRTGNRQDAGRCCSSRRAGRGRAPDRALRRPPDRAGCDRQRIHRRRRGAEERAVARGSRRRLSQLLEDVKSRAATNQASLAVVQEKRTKAQIAMQRAQQVIESLVITAAV